MSFATNDAAAADSGFQVQVRQALMACAVGACGVPADSQGYAQRCTFARLLMTGGCTADLVAGVARAVANDGVTVSGATDEQVLERVEFLWPGLAGG